MIKIIKKIYSRSFKSEPDTVIQMVINIITVKLIGFIYGFRYYFPLSKTKKFITKTRNDIVKNKKSVFVFANGPSLSDIELSKIKILCDSGKYDLIAINSYLSKSALKAKPRFAVFADNVHFKNNESQYTEDIKTCETLSIDYFVPAKYSNNTPTRWGFCSMCDIYAKNTSDITKPAGYYGVTAFFALSLAKMLGYENIYICGYDNSYFKDFEVKSNGDLVIRHSHYYDGVDSVIEVPCLYDDTSDFFFDTYRHFRFLNKIISDTNRIKNIAKRTYLSCARRCLLLDIYN